MTVQQPRQRHNQLNQVNPSSPYFTHVDNHPPQNQQSYQYNNYGGYGVDSSPKTTHNGGNGAYGSSYSAPPPPPPPPQRTEHSAEIKPIRPRNRRGGCMSAGTFLFVMISWTGLLCGCGYYWYTEIKLPEIQRKKQNMKTRMEKLERESADMERRRIQSGQQMLKEMETLREKSHHVEQELRNELQHAQEKVGQVDQQSLEMQENTQRAIQERSKRLVLQKFGPGPHRAEFEIHFPGEDHSWFFTVELAPLDEMPHTVHMFLEQVSLGLYNFATFAFHHNGHHIVYGSPYPNHMTPDELRHEEILAAKFADSGYGSVLFQEYSPNFPHHQYTLGLAGRHPFSGPGFYFNMQDNSQSHGPDGYSADGTADPCFAKIVLGNEVIDRIHGSTGELQYGDWKELPEGVAVRSIKLTS